MRRFSSEEKEKIIRFRKEGNSLYQICRNLNVKFKNKSSVYYHLRKNFGRSFKLVKIDHSDQDAIGEIMGLFAADGSSVPQSNYQVRFHLDKNEEAYAKEFAIILSKMFDKPPRLYDFQGKSITITYKSKLIYEFIKEYLNWNDKKTYTVLLRSLNHSKDFLIGFLRGYFDGDGYSKEDQRTAQFITTSKIMYNQLQEILSLLKLRFDSRVYHDKREGRHTAYYIILRRLEAVKFINLIQPRNSKRVKPWACSITWPVH